MQKHQSRIVSLRVNLYSSKQFVYVFHLINANLCLQATRSVEVKNVAEVRLKEHFWRLLLTSPRINGREFGEMSMCPIADICEQQSRHLCLQQIVSAAGNREIYFAQILALRTAKYYPTLPGSISHIPKYKTFLNGPEKINEWIPLLYVSCKVHVFEKSSFHREYS